MMELLVPFAAAFALAQAFRDGRLRAVIYLGVCLPDAIRGLLHLQGGSPAALAHPLHSPIGAAAWCFAIALLFEEEWRARAFGGLLLGSWLHLAIDAIAAPPGSGQGAFWGLPFNAARLELGWIPETGPWTLRAGSLVVLAVAAAGSRIRRRGRPA